MRRHCLAPLGDGGGDGLGAAADLEVLDRLLGDLAHAADQVVLEPARLLAAEGRDQHLVDLVVLDRVLDGQERVRAHRLAGGVDVGAVELGQGRGEVAGDLGLGDALGPRADDRVAVRPRRRPLLQPRDEVGGGDRLGRDDERVDHVEADRVVHDPDRDVGHLDLRFELLARPLDEVLAGEPEAGLVEAGEKHLAGVMGADRVVERQRRMRVHHLADRVDPVLGEDRHRHLDPGPSRIAQLAGVDQLARGRLVLGRRDGHRGDAVEALLDGFDQLAAAGDLVEEDQQRARLDLRAHVNTSRFARCAKRQIATLARSALMSPPLSPAPAGQTSAPSPPMIAWRAPGTPYS